MAEDEVKFEVVDRFPGYAHVRIYGTYTGPATVEDVKKRFYHSYFGGRDPWCSDGRFGVVVHTD
jgi:hypothetical protein